MAGSRLELIGTVFSRMSGLLRTNAIKYEDRPIWYDIYRVFPPKLEPQYARQPVLPAGVPEEVPELMYKEDIPRAAFYKKFGSNPGGVARNLTIEMVEDASTRFIEKYNAVQAAQPNRTNEEIVETVCQNFSVGFSSRREYQIVSKVEGSESITMESDSFSPAPEIPKRGGKRTIVTADTLLSMFNEAKQKSQQKKDD